MGDVLLSGLMIGACDDHVCLRASRFWDFFDTNDLSKLLHSDLVLIDEEGNSIHAQMYPPAEKKFKELIKEGSVYSFSCFKVRKANSKYRPVANNLMLSFSTWTMAEKVVEIPPAFPMWTYSLIPIEQVPARVDYQEYFTDTIGKVTTVSNVITLRGRGGQGDRLKRVVTICSESNALIDVVLWGEHATSFPGEQVYKDGQTSPQVVIFVGTIVRSYFGVICMTGSSACRWYINPDAPEAKSLVTSIGNTCQPVTWNEQMSLTGPTIAAEHKKISDIKFLNPFKAKKTEFLVTVTIRKIESSWWYNSCQKCVRTAKPHGDLYKCIDPECNHIGKPTPRLEDVHKLSITAGDETGDTQFIMFGRWAQRLTKKTVDSLIAENPRDFIPNEITRLLEKVFVWNVSFTDNSTDSRGICFQVNAVIREISDGNALSVTPAGSESSSLMLSQGASGSMQSTPQKSAAWPLLSLPTALETSHASSATPTKEALNIPAPPVTPQSGKSTAVDETTPHKGAGITSPKHTAALQTLAETPTTLQDSDDISALKVDNPELNADVPAGSATHKSTTKKRSRSSPDKKTAKKLFKDEDNTGNGDEDTFADAATKPSTSPTMDA